MRRTTARRLIWPLLGILLLAPPAAQANDGFGGLTASGLRFARSSSVRMVAEELHLSPQMVRVHSLFRNETGTEVGGEVIFPLPPIALADLLNTGFAVPEEQLRRDNPVDFTAAVDGRQIEVRTERIAVLEPPPQEGRRAADPLASPAREVTAELVRLGIPLSLDAAQVSAHLAQLPRAAKAQLQASGLADFAEQEQPQPNWSIVVRYHWPQRFPPGRGVRIEHSYHPSPPGGIFTWPARETDLGDYERELINAYCIDPATRKGLTRLLHPGRTDAAPGTGTAIMLDYVLTTARTWHGPIATFRLTIDKGDPRSILSLCMDGLRKTGPTTFMVEKKDFTPQQDLRLLIVSPPAP